MAYSDAARARRRCTGTRKDGKPCQAWAMWNDPEQRCMAHAGRHHTGPMQAKHPPGRRFAPSRRAQAPPCTCAAYPWPHRPGGGLCRWPDTPQETSPAPAGERLPGVLRTDTAGYRMLVEAFGKKDVERQREEIAAMVRGALGSNRPRSGS